MHAMKKVRERMRRSTQPRHLNGQVYTKKQDRVALHELHGDPLVVVSVAVREIPQELLERAVRSVLSQTYENILVIVTSDGERAPSWSGCSFVDDPRVVCWTLPRRHGPYYAHELARIAGGGEIFAVQDSDDWSHPERIEKLVRAIVDQGLDAAFPQHVIVEHGIEKKPPPVRPPTAGVGYRASHFWAVRTDVIEALGGYYTGDGHVCHTDTFLTNMVLDFGRTAVVPGALYFRETRSGSLETSPETGRLSPIRKKIDRELTAVYQVAHHRGLDAARSMTLSRSRTEEFFDDLSRLRKLTPAAGIGTALSLFPFTSWSISRRCAARLYERCREIGARNILDFGSGASTMAFATYAKEHGARVTTIEHDRHYMDETKRALRVAGLDGVVDFRHALIDEVDVMGMINLGYVVPELPHGVDFVFVDGPPMTIGRLMTLPSAAPYLADSWEAWLHDGCRDHEKSVVGAWRRVLPPFRSTLSTTDDDRGVYVLQSAAGR